MNRKDQLDFCKVCIHKKNDLQKGIVCALTNERANFKDTCPNFKIDEKRAKEEKEKLLKRIEDGATGSSTSRSPVWTIIFVILVLIRIGFKINRYQRNKQKNKDNIKEQLEEIKRYNRQLIKNQPKAISYLASAERVAIKRKRVNKDTSFMVAKNLQVSVHKRYYMSIVANDELPVLAISRGYCFTENKVAIDKSKSMTEQWLAIRKKFSRDFNYELIKKYTVEDKKVEDINFIIPGYRNVYGVARLVEIGGKRYFFHFAFKQETPDYNMLRRYLNYYVIIK